MRGRLRRLDDAAPDTRRNLLIAMARWGGLRVSSEALASNWGDVDWEQQDSNLPQEPRGKRQVAVRAAQNPAQLGGLGPHRRVIPRPSRAAMIVA